VTPDGSMNFLPLCKVACTTVPDRTDWVRSL